MLNQAKCFPDHDGIQLGFNRRKLGKSKEYVEIK